MYLLVLFLPLLSAIISGLFGRKIGTKGAGVLTSSCITVSAIISCCIFYETTLNSSATYIKLWRWFDFELLTTPMGLQFDSLTSAMLVVITSVSALVHIYSTGYMSGDPHIPRFMSYLSFFTFLMVVLVTSDNYIQLFIGWEGVGLCSYLLINFWFTRIKANKAAIKAMLINRVGDIGLVLAMLMIFKEFGTLEFLTIDSLLGLNPRGENITIICLLLFLGAVGKSAQLGLHTWLPDAMEGPTPVSALIHAATMVTAGVFLIIRSGPLFEGSPLALTVVTICGALTAFFAATTGAVQNDLKKVIAYSTCSQLGYMVMACGISNYSTSLFHLINHGFFKALLFLSAGSVIHAVSDEQDMRKMGGLIKSIPLTYVLILIGSLSLAGFPYLTGFYSKDLILELTYDKYYIAFAFWLGSLSALLTAYYSMRLVYLTFIIETNSKREVFLGAHEPGLSITVPLVLLALGSIFVGYLAKEVALSNVIPPIVLGSIKIIPLALTLVGVDAAFKRGRLPVPPQLSGSFLGTKPKGGLSVYFYQSVYTFFNSAWQFNYVINHFIVKNIWKFGHLITYRVIDRGLLEIMGPRGVSRVLILLTQKFSNLQSGLVFNYALIMIVFTTLFIYTGCQPHGVLAQQVECRPCTSKVLGSTPRGSTGTKMVNLIISRLGDTPEPWQLGFQDAASPVMEEIVFFHDQIMFILTIIMTTVFWVIVRALTVKRYHKYLIDGTLIEIIWTLIPAVILVFIAFPSLKLLYLMDEVIDPALTIKAIGHQWYWSYEYSDYGADTIEFDSYMIPTADLSSGDLRLLEVDNRLVVPIQTQVRVLVTGGDVLHSFAVPSLSVKIDAVPGRLNQTSFFIKRPGVFYGQCSEICGANHSFMPIVIEAVSLDKYIHWVATR